MNIEQDLVLLMTAAIAVNPGIPSHGGVRIQDPHQREADYLASFRYYLTHHSVVRKIVLFDNSGWPMDKFHQAARDDNPLGKQVEVLSQACNDFPAIWGKGYGEMLLIDRALESSKLLAESPYFAKLTGRLRVLNMSDILLKTRGDYQMLCELRDHHFFRNTGIPYLSIFKKMGIPYQATHGETRFFVIAKELFNEHFRGRYEQWQVPEWSMEAFLYQQVKKLEPHGRIVCRFPVEPIYAGIAGSTGKDYGGSKERIRRTVRGLLRRACPNLRV